MKHCIAIIQCRSGSTRLPAKVLLPFHQEATILDLVFARVIETFGVPNTILATTTNPSDDRIAFVGESQGLVVCRGSEEDVVERFIHSLELAPPHTHFCRICADNPFLCRNGLRQLRDVPQQVECDYASFAFADGTPSILSHCGLYGELVRSETFKQLAKVATIQRHREHITTHILDNPDQYTRHFLPVPDEVQTCPHLRLTVDTQADFGVSQRLYATLVSRHGVGFTTNDLIREFHRVDDYARVMQNEIRTNEKK